MAFMLASCAYGFGQHIANLTEQNRKTTLKVSSKRHGNLPIPYSFFTSFLARSLDLYSFLTSTLPAFLCQSSFLQAHFEHYQDVNFDAISTHLHPELVPHYMLCAVSYHRFLHARGILRLRIPMHASGTSLGQNYFRLMY